MFSILVKRRDRHQWLESPSEFPIFHELAKVLTTPRAHYQVNLMVTFILDD